MTDSVIYIDHKKSKIHFNYYRTILILYFIIFQSFDTALHCR